MGRRAACFSIGGLLLVIVALLPFAVGSVVNDFAQLSRPSFVLSPPADPLPEEWAVIDLDVLALNEWEGTATIRASVERSCLRRCSRGDNFLFVSVYDDPRDSQPTSESMTLAADLRDLTQTIKLPLEGDPLRYPFDRYEMSLGILVEHVLPDGTVRRLSRAEAEDYLIVTMEGRIPRVVLGAPTLLDAGVVSEDDDAGAYLALARLTFDRPLYLQVLTVLLILLVSAAAAYAVFLRPLDQLLINAGGLVLGVWGIRAILLGVGVPGVTAVDLSLAVVILFLLTAITVRTLWLLAGDAEMRLLARLRLRRPLPPVEPAPDAAPAASIGDFIPALAARRPRPRGRSRAIAGLRRGLDREMPSPSPRRPRP